MTYSHPSPRNPMRPVDWRWTRAGQVASGTVPFNGRRDDAWVRKAARFRAGLQAAATDIDFARLAEAHPELYYAHQLFSAADRDTGPAAFRYGVEARLLAGSTDGDVAERTGMEAGDVEAYSKVFFDVRDRRAHRDFVMTMVIGPAVHRGLNSRDYDLLWKLYGYMRGPAVLDSLIATFDGGPRQVAAGDVADSLAKDQGFDIRRQASFASKSLRILVETQADVVGLYYKLSELERNAGGTGTANDAITLQIAGFLGQVDHYRVGAPAGGATGLDALSYEPTTEELVRAGLGQVVEIDAELAALEFPTAAAQTASA